jgi:hypothetical protein
MMGVESMGEDGRIIDEASERTIEGRLHCTTDQ